MIFVFCIRWADSALVAQTARPYLGIERRLEGLHGTGFHLFVTRDVEESEESEPWWTTP